MGDETNIHDMVTGASEGPRMSLRPAVNEWIRLFFSKRFSTKVEGIEPVYVHFTSKTWFSWQRVLLFEPNVKWDRLRWAFSGALTALRKQLGRGI